MILALVLAAAPVDAALLKGLPSAEVTLVAHGKTQHCAGPSLASVLAKLGYPAGEKLGGKALAGGIVARASDGYAVLLSLGEIDATLGNETAIIATTCDGKPLDDKEGPFRLILPDEKRPARSVRQLVSLEPITATVPDAPAHRH